jgi:ribulose bisphosphate carboxylase small subunit
VQSPTWKLGAVSISILRRQFDKTYVAVAFDNNGRAVTLNFIVVNGPDGWVISDVESPHDSLRMFLAQYRH